MIRKEWLAVNTFGQRARGSNLREVVGIDLTPVGGRKVITIEAFVVRQISRLTSKRAFGSCTKGLSPLGAHMALSCLPQQGAVRDRRSYRGRLFVAFSDRKCYPEGSRRASSGRDIFRLSLVP